MKFIFKSELIFALHEQPKVQWRLERRQLRYVIPNYKEREDFPTFDIVIVICALNGDK